MDLNHRPPGPEPGALARLRYAPTALILPLLQKAQTKAIDLPDPIRDALARLRYAPTDTLGSVLPPQARLSD